MLLTRPQMTNTHKSLKVTQISTCQTCNQTQDIQEVIREYAKRRLEARHFDTQGTEISIPDLYRRLRSQLGFTAPIGSLSRHINVCLNHDEKETNASREIHSNQLRRRRSSPYRKSRGSNGVPGKRKLQTIKGADRPAGIYGVNSRPSARSVGRARADENIGRPNDGQTQTRRASGRTRLVRRANR